MSEPVGIIYPPPDVRGVVDNMAKYVAKNGRDFEETVLRKHRDNPKFSFLLSNDPFHAYYRHKVNEIKSKLAEAESKLSCEQESSVDRSQRTEGVQGERNHKQNDRDERDKEHEGQDEGDRSNNQSSRDGSDRLQQDNGEGEEHAENKTQDDDIRKDDSEDTTPGVKSTLNEYIQEMTLKLEEPPHLSFLANPASFITHFERDAIKLTASFIATYGRPFLLRLVSQEQGNPRFDFLRPQHGQFPYMTRLIMQYALIQNPPLDILDQLESDSTSQRHILERCKQRAEWNKMLEIEKKRREEAEEKEKLLYSQIDWHDFVVVETVDYPYNEVGEYPPTTADQVGTRLLKQQRKEDLSAPEEMDIDMDVESDNESAGSDQDEPSKAEFAAPYPPDDESRVVIRRDYDPKAVAKIVSQPEATFVSPITNERIPAGQIHDHMRYNLSDPRHLELKEKSRQDRAREEAVFASGSQIQDNLKSLAQRRTDVFGSNNEQAAMGQRIDDEKDGQTKDNKVLWDGHKSSIKRKKLN